MSTEDETFRRLARITPAEMKRAHDSWLSDPEDTRDWYDVLKSLHWSEDEWHQFLRIMQNSTWD